MVRGWQMYDHREAMPEVCNSSKSNGRLAIHRRAISGDMIMLLAEQDSATRSCLALRFTSGKARRESRAGGALAQIADLLLAWCFGEQMPQFHFHSRLLSLPRVFDTTPFNIPHDVPYMRPAGRVEHWREKIASDGSGDTAVKCGWSGREAQHIQMTRCDLCICRTWARLETCRA